MVWIAVVILYLNGKFKIHYGYQWLALLYVKLYVLTHPSLSKKHLKRFFECANCFKLPLTAPSAYPFSVFLRAKCGWRETKPDMIQSVTESEMVFQRAEPNTEEEISTLFNSLVIFSDLNELQSCGLHHRANCPCMMLPPKISCELGWGFDPCRTQWNKLCWKIWILASMLGLLCSKLTGSYFPEFSMGNCLVLSGKARGRI